ncbi:MAM and LDL-receptor class A domain-containing protein 1-like [Haliotis rufescens]|uniref:MAM and LDL-receptor class A domain-containing protein 1-like n=1 Tax=Haliotis rufescens TaxID=6454 RepID=UPI00201ED518|nr:MAM and LDL-receptor class A domain-containing protein 1-like [Haliotis rufescens]
MAMTESTGGTSRALFVLAAVLFVVHNVVFVVFTVRQFNEEELLRQQYQDQQERIRLLKRRCPSLQTKREALVDILDTPEEDHANKRQTNALLERLITEQELILEKHCSNGTGFCVQGEKGDTGPLGDTGPKGLLGTVGQNGEMGDNGTRGIQGPPGIKGQAGQTGEPGLKGEQGMDGVQGDKGLSGQQGIEGEQGINGTSGLQGAKGLKGDAGMIGDPGAKGEQGGAGVKGDAGLPGVKGSKGEQGLDGHTPYVDSNCTCVVQPYIIGPTKETIVGKRNGGVTLNCTVGGDPPSKVTWMKTGSALPLDATQQGPLLIIPGSRSTDAGEYKCLADNGAGHVEKTFNVKFLALSCDFERDFCSWTQSQTDNTDWIYHTGGTPTGSTGPSSDHTTGHGYYVYMETSLGNINDKADLVSPVLGGNTVTCLRMWYHMFGTDVNSLTVFKEYQNGSRTSIWHEDGDQGNQWNHMAVTIPATSPSYRVVLEAQRGKSIEGDIALDDIEVTDGVCPMTALDLNCDFESGTCLWNQATDDEKDLIINNGATPSLQTGPTSDHTRKDTRGHYLYLETSTGAAGDTARVVSPLLTNKGAMCFSVWYHMSGSGVGSLNVYVQKHGEARQMMWTHKGSQGNEWKLARFSVPASAKQYNIIIEMTKGANSYGDIAIDDITGTAKSCPPPANPLDCDFESQLCSWTPGTKDDFDWSIKSGPPSRGYVGPPTDHTLQTGSGHYIYLDPKFASAETAGLVSPLLTANTIFCLDFWYYMDGQNIGSLRIRRMVFDVPVETLSLLDADAGKGWHHTTVKIDSYWTQFNLDIVGIRGTVSNSYIAIDDVTVSQGGCN